MSRPLESEAALHRYETMLATEERRALTRGCMVSHDAPSLALLMYPRIPERAWRGIAWRLDICAQIVPSASAPKFADRARDAWARAGGAA